MDKYFELMNRKRGVVTLKLRNAVVRGTGVCQGIFYIILNYKTIPPKMCL